MQLLLQEDAAILDWFYDPKPLLDTPHVNGSSYRYQDLTLPIMANLYRLGRALLSDHTDQWRSRTRATSSRKAALSDTSHGYAS